MPERTERVNNFIKAVAALSVMVAERRAREGEWYLRIMRKLHNFPEGVFGDGLRLGTLGQKDSQEFEVLQRILVEKGLDETEIQYVRVTVLRASMPEIKGVAHPYVRQHDSLTIGEVKQLLNHGVYNHANYFTKDRDPYQTGVAVLQRILS